MIPIEQFNSLCRDEVIVLTLNNGKILVAKVVGVKEGILKFKYKINGKFITAFIGRSDIKEIN